MVSSVTIKPRYHEYAECKSTTIYYANIMYTSLDYIYVLKLNTYILYTTIIIIT